MSPCQMIDNDLSVIVPLPFRFSTFFIWIHEKIRIFATYSEHGMTMLLLFHQITFYGFTRRNQCQC
jgi:hypothetical protein